MKRNIGIVSSWDLRGGGHCGRFLAKSLIPYYNVHVYAHFLYSNEDPINVASFVHYKNKEFDYNSFTKWVTQNNIDTIFFHEKLQYDFDKNANEILKFCRENRIISILILMQEIIYDTNTEHYKKFAYIFCPVRCTYDILEKHGIKNKFFLRWGIEEHKFAPIDHDFNSNNIILLYNLGLGGGQRQRKNPFGVLKAFYRAAKINENLVLIFKTQRPLKDYPVYIRALAKKIKNIKIIQKNYTENQMKQLYAKTHISVLPSKWEGIGIPFIEALAAGHPLLTVDCAPMNEWVQDGVNGYCAKVGKYIEKYKVNVDSRDLAKKMLLIATDMQTLKNMSNNSRKMAENSFNNFSSGLHQIVEKLIPPETNFDANNIIEIAQGKVR